MAPELEQGIGETLLYFMDLEARSVGDLRLSGPGQPDRLERPLASGSIASSAAHMAVQALHGISISLLGAAQLALQFLELRQYFRVALGEVADHASIREEPVNITACQHQIQVIGAIIFLDELEMPLQLRGFFLH